MNIRTGLLTIGITTVLFTGCVSEMINSTAGIEPNTLSAETTTPQNENYISKKTKTVTTEIDKKIDDKVDGFMEKMMNKIF